MVKKIEMNIHLTCTENVLCVVNLIENILFLIKINEILIDFIKARNNFSIDS